MKRQTQKTGVRTYFGDDLVDLQTQPLNAIDAMLAAAGQCVISGCEVTPQGDKFDIAPGYVALEATDQVTDAVRIMAMPFAGVSGVTLPVYLMASVDVVERAYGDGAVKPIAYAYNAIASAIKPLATPSIEITAGYTRELSDALAESLAKYVAVTATEKAVWDAKANANHSHGVATAAADGFMAKGDKSKLDGVATSANNYTHPANTNTRHVTDAEKTTWNGKANADHSHGIATAAADGFMAKGDKSKLDGIAAGANNYTHPVDVNTQHISLTERSNWNAKAEKYIYKDNGISLPSTAEINMPCVALAGYGVTSGGSIVYRFGAKQDAIGTIARPAGTTGVYTIPHKIGHTQYNIEVAIQAPAGERFFGWNEVKGSRTSISVQIKICEMQVGAVNADFTITFFGKN